MKPYVGVTDKEWYRFLREFPDIDEMQDRTGRDDRWSEAIAIGNLAFVENVKSELGSKAHNIEQLNILTEDMRCASEVRLTTAIYRPKPSL